MARSIKPASEVHPAPPAPEPIITEETAQPEPSAEPAPAEPPTKSYRVIVGQIQRCQFDDKTTWDALPGKHDITDLKLIENLRRYINVPGAKRCIEIHDPK